MDSAELPLVIRKSPWPFLVTILGAATGAVILFSLPDIYSDTLRFSLAYVLCAITAGSVVFLAQRKPDLVISADGIQAADWGHAMVRWDEIENVFVVSRKGIDFLCLTLLRVDDFRERGGPLAKFVTTLNRQAELGDLMFRPSSFRLNTNEVLQLIRVLTGWHKSEARPKPSAVRYHMD